MLFLVCDHFCCCCDQSANYDLESDATISDVLNTTNFQLVSLVEVSLLALALLACVRQSWLPLSSSYSNQRRGSSPGLEMNQTIHGRRPSDGDEEITVELSDDMTMTLDQATDMPVDMPTTMEVGGEEQKGSKTSEDGPSA